MKIGTEDKKKVAFLSALGLVAVYLVYSNVFSQPDRGGPPPAAQEPGRAGALPLPGPEGTPVQEAAPAEAARAPASNRNAFRGRSEEFHPVLHSKRPEDRIDPMSIDPTMRLDLLAKVQAVEQAGGSRNLFQYGPPPVKAEPPKGPEPKVVPKPPDDPAKPPPPPPPTPISLKYYGFSTPHDSGKKRAFFVDGDEIWVAGEGEMVKKRYRVVRIGVNSVVVEDTESKRQQSLPLTEEQPS